MDDVCDDLHSVNDRQLSYIEVDGDSLDDVCDDLHSINDSQVVDVDICLSGGLPFASSASLHRMVTLALLQLQASANTSIYDLNSNSPIISVDNHVHQDQTIDSQATLDFNNDSTDNGPWCYCQKDKPDELMVICESGHCLIRWFHL